MTCITCHKTFVQPPKRKCGRCRKPPVYTITTLRPANKGRNARGIAAHKPDKSYTKRPKKQSLAKVGARPEIAMSHWNNV